MATPSQKTDSSVTIAKALQKNFVHLVTAINTANTVNIGDELYAADLISQEILDKLDLPTNTSYDKSRILVKSVLDKLKVVPDELETFMEILQKSIDKASFQSKCTHWEANHLYRKSCVYS